MCTIIVDIFISTVSHYIDAFMLGRNIVFYMLQEPPPPQDFMKQVKICAIKFLYTATSFKRREERAKGGRER